jgi:hypothetical protein
MAGPRSYVGNQTHIFGVNDGRSFSQRMFEMETYREKALKCARAADEAHSSSERVGLLGLASVYTALADYVDDRRWTAQPAEQGQDMHFQ